MWNLNTIRTKSLSCSIKYDWIVLVLQNPGCWHRQEPSSRVWEGRQLDILRVYLSLWNTFRKCHVALQVSNRVLLVHHLPFLSQLPLATDLVLSSMFRLELETLVEMNITPTCPHLFLHLLSPHWHLVLTRHPVGCVESYANDFLVYSRAISH